MPDAMNKDSTARHCCAIVSDSLNVGGLLFDEPLTVWNAVVANNYPSATGRNPQSVVVVSPGISINNSAPEDRSFAIKCIPFVLRLPIVPERYTILADGTG